MVLTTPGRYVPFQVIGGIPGPGVLPSPGGDRGHTARVDRRGEESTPRIDRQTRRYRVTGPLSDASWTVGVVDVLTRELPQGIAELSVLYLARRCPESHEDYWRQPVEPMSEISVGGHSYDPVTTSFGHEDRALIVEGRWRFHVPNEHLQCQSVEIRLVSGDDETVRRRSTPIEMELLD